jgi:tetratricopeptide (TPR) repeat protein
MLFSTFSLVVTASANIVAGSGVPPDFSFAYAAPDSVRKVAKAKFTPESFGRYRDRMPVLFTLDGTPRLERAQQAFSFSNLKDKHGDSKMSCGMSHVLIQENGHSSQKRTLNQFLDTGGGDHPEYLFDRGSFFSQHPELAEVLYEALPDPLVRLNYPAELFFALGTNGSGIQFHEHYETWNLLLSGKKRWFFFEPQQLPPGNVFVSDLVHWLQHVAPKLEGRERPFECVQEPGQIVYIPEGFYHATLIEGGVSIGVAGQLMEGRSKAYSLAQSAKHMVLGNNDDISKPTQSDAFELAASDVIASSNGVDAKDAVAALAAMQQHLQHPHPPAAQLGRFWNILRDKENGVIRMLQTRFQHDPQNSPAISKNLLLVIEGMQEAMSIAKHSHEPQTTLDTALDLFDQALQLAPGIPEFHYEKSRLLNRMEKPQLAAQEALASLAKSPKHVDSLMMLGVALKITGDFKRAIVAYKKALEVESRFAAPHFELAQCYDAIGERRKAEHHAQLGEQKEREAELGKLGRRASVAVNADSSVQPGAPTLGNVDNSVHPDASAAVVDADSGMQLEAGAEMNALLASLDLSQYVLKFRAEGFDQTDDVRSMGVEEFMSELGMKRGHAKRLVRHFSRD